MGPAPASVQGALGHGTAGQHLSPPPSQVPMLPTGAQDVPGAGGGGRGGFFNPPGVGEWVVEWCWPFCQPDPCSVGVSMLGTPGSPCVTSVTSVAAQWRGIGAWWPR